MAYCEDCNSADDEARSAVPQKVFGGVALGLIALACGWTLYANLFGVRQEDVLASPPITVVNAQPAAAVAATEAPTTAPRKRNLLTAPRFEVTLLDAAPTLGLPPVTFAQRAPLTSALQSAPPPVRVVQSVPIPAPRPTEALALAQRVKAVAENPFDKLFGKPKESGPALAYASADGGVFNDGQSKSLGRLPPNDGQTAIYDISARTVYLPDGTKLEAHSGLRDKLDDPNFVHVKMRGATPPHTYDLVPREALFHGVEALRLIPAGGEGAIFGRTGLLAHTYLLGPNGDSNGCVSFKNYDAFLRAYKSGQVKRLVVVASIDDPQTDLRVAERRPSPTRPTRTASFSLASESSTSVPLTDDRYMSGFSFSRASRTSSSARSFSSLPE